MLTLPLLFASLQIAAPPAVPQPDPCSPMRVERASDGSAKARLLGPAGKPARLEKAVERTVGGCITPVVVRDGIGAGAR